MWVKPLFLMWKQAGQNPWGDKSTAEVLMATEGQSDIPMESGHGCISHQPDSQHKGLAGSLLVGDVCSVLRLLMSLPCSTDGDCLSYSSAAGQGRGVLKKATLRPQGQPILRGIDPQRHTLPLGSSNSLEQNNFTLLPSHMVPWAG